MPSSKSIGWCVFKKGPRKKVKLKNGMIVSVASGCSKFKSGPYKRRSTAVDAAGKLGDAYFFANMFADEIGKKKKRGK